jgi:hypothetical protein
MQKTVNPYSFGRSTEVGVQSLVFKVQSIEIGGQKSEEICNR